MDILVETMLDQIFENRTIQSRIRMRYSKLDLLSRRVRPRNFNNIELTPLYKDVSQSQH